MTYEEINRHYQQEATRQQEAMRAERLQREALDLQRRQTWALERQSSDHGGIIGLLLLGLTVAGIAWAVMWFVGVIWRAAGRKKNSPDTPTDQENELLGLLRRHDTEAAEASTRRRA
jgi:hypothetical protein